VQDPLLPEVLNVPVVQAAHCRSLLGPGMLTVCVPAGQLDAGEQAVAFVVVLWLPLGQGAQIRSEVAEPALFTKLPGAQSVLLTQIVAGFPSLSQVFAPHGIRGAEPPAQNSPTLHAEHL
jgi:hypothetical protein